MCAQCSTKAFACDIRWCVCVCLCVRVRGDDATIYLSSSVHVSVNGWVRYRHLWKCGVVNVGCNSAPECLFTWTQTSIAGRPLVFPALEGDAVVVTHTLHPGCICGALMTSRILILFIVLYFFNYLFSLLFKHYANEVYACVCVCASLRAVWMRYWTLQPA